MILENKTIFILGISKFDGVFQSTSFTTAKFLAERNDVYYIDYPFTFKDYLSNNKDLKVQFDKRRSSFYSKEKCLIATPFERLKILILPPLLSLNFLPENKLYRLLLSFNENLLINRIKSVINQNEISDFIFINSFNFHYPNIGSKLKPNLLVYHCVDPIIVEYDKKHGLVSEKKILKQSQLVICTSKQLYNEKIIHNKNTFFIPNAADVKHSSQALKEELPVYYDLQKIRKPIVGYFGNIERRIDFDLLQKVVLQNLDKNFVFVGPIEGDYIPERFRDMLNVHFLGKVSYDDMPSVLKGFDVAVIPFKKDDVSATIFPLKLFEYLGAGKPVVSTNFNSDLVDYTGDTVIYCENKEEFTDAINLSLNQDLPEQKQKRLAVALENTWDKRLSEFSELISRFYKEKFK